MNNNVFFFALLVFLTRAKLVMMPGCRKRLNLVSFHLFIRFSKPGHAATALRGRKDRERAPVHGIRRAKLHYSSLSRDQLGSIIERSLQH